MQVVKSTLVQEAMSSGGCRETEVTAHLLETSSKVYCLTTEAGVREWLAKHGGCQLSVFVGWLFIHYIHRRM